MNCISSFVTYISNENVTAWESGPGPWIPKGSQPPAALEKEFEPDAALSNYFSH